MDSLFVPIIVAAWITVGIGCATYSFILCPRWDRRRIIAWVRRHHPEWVVRGIRWQLGASWVLGGRLRCYRLDIEDASGQLCTLPVATGALAGVWVDGAGPIAALRRRPMTARIERRDRHKTPNPA